MESTEILVGAASLDEAAPRLADLTEAVFRGPLVEVGLDVREGQIAMARAVADAIAEGPKARLAVEAPTGSGKGNAYLVPAVLALLRAHARLPEGGARVVVSTSGIALQRQIVGKDVPALARALGIDISAGVVKGRSNFACLDRLAEVGEESGVVGEEARRVRDWIEDGGSGDREDLPWPVKRWGALSVGSDDCLGQGCAFADQCLATLATERARKAKIVVMNHAYFALAGGRWIAEGAIALIADEAHDLEDALRGAQSGDLHDGQAEYWRSEVVRLTLGIPFAGPRDDGPADDGPPAVFVSPAPTSASAWFEPFPEVRSEGWALQGQRVYEAIATVLGAAARAAGKDPTRLHPGWWDGEAKPGAPLAEAAKLLEEVEDLDDRTQARVNRAVRNLRRLASRLNLASAVADGYAVWTEREERDRGPRLLVKVAPIQARLPDREVPTVLCSATLGAGRPAEAAATIGVEARELVLPPAWPVGEMAVCYVPAKGPAPKDPGWAEWCDRGAVWFARQCGGGVLVLASSRVRAHALAEALRQAVPWRVRVQGEAGRTELVDWFREDEDGILVGTASFRQGLDVAGRACRGVLIDRIPFPSPGDPLEEAIAEQYADGFREHSVPVAAQALRQAVGRLIRTATDRGVVCVLDVRLGDATWARRLREAVGPIPVTRDSMDVGRVLAGEPARSAVVELPRPARTVRTARSARS